MTMVLIFFVGLAVVVLVIGGIIALIVHLVKKNKSEPQQLTVLQSQNDRLKKLEEEVSDLKKKLENLKNS